MCHFDKHHLKCAQANLAKRFALPQNETAQGWIRNYYEKKWSEFSGAVMYSEYRVGVWVKCDVCEDDKITSGDEPDNSMFLSDYLPSF